MKLKMIATLTLVAALSTSCKDVANTISSSLNLVGGGPTIVASGPSVKQQRALSSINEIVVDAGISVVYRQADSLSLIVEAPENIQSCIATNVANGCLTIKPEKSFRSENRNIQVIVTAPAVNDLSVSAGASLAVQGSYRSEVPVEVEAKSGASFSMAELVAPNAEVSASSGASASIAGVQLQQLEVESSGGATVSLSGGANVAGLKASGGATISASGLKALSGSVKASGGATVSSNIKNASVHTSGGGSVSNR